MGAVSPIQCLSKGVRYKGKLDMQTHAIRVFQAGGTTLAKAQRRLSTLPVAAGRVMPPEVLGGPYRHTWKL